MKPLRLTALVVALLAGAAVQAPWAADAPKPSATAADSQTWRDVSPDNLVLIETKYGTVAVELAPDFAPGHVARMRKLLHAHFYDGLTFYRVIDGFVAQGGADQDTSATADAPVNPELLKAWPPLKAEFDAALPKSAVFTPLGNPDLVAPQVGYVNGFAVGRDPKDGRAWLIQCPGVFAFARDNADDTATTEFYIVIGEAPRRLDRNLTAFGRVLSGMEYLQKLNRGNPDVDSGVIPDAAKRDPILHMILASDLPEKDRPHYQVMRTDSAAFAALLASKRKPAPEFYHRPGGFPNLDICGVSAPVRQSGN
ncbi:MAG: peptidylprolyl isomerase [Proteobacteria bacterium]|nr:peptidylprolyl isomerase [Pseudomonadota bacterium]